MRKYLAIGVMLLLGDFAFASAKVIDLPVPVRLFAEYETQGYKYWQSLKSTNEILFVSKYLELMNLQLKSDDLRTESNFLKYKCLVFRDFFKADVLVKKIEVWRSALNLLSDIRSTYSASCYEMNKSIKVEHSLTNFIGYANRKREFSNICNEMLAAEYFIKENLMGKVNEIKVFFEGDGFQKPTSASCAIVLTNEIWSAIKRKNERCELFQQNPPTSTNTMIRIKPL